MEIHRNEGNPARFELQHGKERQNEKLVALIKKFPFPFKNREFVTKFIWRKAEKGVDVAWTSAADVVDYGGSMGTLRRGTSKGIFKSRNFKDEETGLPRCKILLLQVRQSSGMKQEANPKTSNRHCSST